MTLRLRKRYMFALLLAAGLYSSYSEWWQLTAPATDSDTDSKTTDFYIRNIQQYSFDTDGRLSTTLKADQASRMKDDNAIVFSQPDIFFQQKQQHWQATAVRAVGNLKSSNLSFDGDVQLKRSDNSVVINSESLSFDDDKKRIFSDTAVEIQVNGSHTRAGQLAIDLQQQTLQLQQGVTTSYDPNTDASTPAQP